MATAEKLSVTLPRDLAELIRRKVKTGAYASNSEVIRDALRLWQEREATEEQKRQWLRARIDRSLVDPRPSIDADDVFADLEARYPEE